MKTIQEIYNEYKIMPSLQLHQLRVAAVAKNICENLNTKVDTENVAKACLLHDMGNILKFDLPRFPDFLQPEGLDYWQSIKDEFSRKYGREEHVATEIIAKEIGLNKKATAYLDMIGFSQLGVTNEKGSLENKICSYADMRVGPYGVITIEERLIDGRKRYEGRKHMMLSDQFEELQAALRQIELDIFNDAKIKPEEVTDQVIADAVQNLRTYTIV